MTTMQTMYDSLYISPKKLVYLPLIDILDFLYHGINDNRLQYIVLNSGNPVPVYQSNPCEFTKQYQTATVETKKLINSI